MVITVPRLELCGALTVARLYKEACSVLNFKMQKITFWSDSSIVIHWLKKSLDGLKVFESNRVVQIQELGGKVEWRHIRSDDNPANALSRGHFPSEFLNNKLWFDDPTWLRQFEEVWPNCIEITITELLPSLKQNTCLALNVKHSDIFSNFSSYLRTIRVLAYY